MHLPSEAASCRSAFASSSSRTQAALPASAAQCRGESPSSLPTSALMKPNTMTPWRFDHCRGSDSVHWYLRLCAKHTFKEML